VEVCGDVGGAVGGEGDVFVAGAFVDCEGDEVGGGHWIFLELVGWVGVGGFVWREGRFTVGG
jgi:hypothetical protein